MGVGSHEFIAHIVALAGESTVAIAWVSLDSSDPLLSSCH